MEKLEAIRNDLIEVRDLHLNDNPNWHVVVILSHIISDLADAIRLAKEENKPTAAAQAEPLTSLDM